MSKREKNELKTLEQILRITRRALSEIDQGAISLAKSDLGIAEMMLDTIVKRKQEFLRTQLTLFDEG